MSYVYIRSEPGLFSVGFFDPSGKWHPESDFNDREQAAERVAWLNGGAPTVRREIIGGGGAGSDSVAPTVSYGTNGRPRS